MLRKSDLDEIAYTSLFHCAHDIRKHQLGHIFFVIFYVDFTAKDDNYKCTHRNTVYPTHEVSFINIQTEPADRDMRADLIIFRVYTHAVYYNLQSPAKLLFQENCYQYAVDLNLLGI